MGCVFCAIADGGIPADKVWESERVLAFHDLAPQAPVHVLVIPRRHVVNLAECAPEDRELLGELLDACRQVAAKTGILESGFRVVLNSNADGGQSVAHLHAHVLGGRALGWPPG